MNDPIDTFIDPNDLEVGETYVLSRKTPLMPHYDPPDPLGALKYAKSMEPNVLITVLERKEPEVGLWYRVKVTAFTVSPPDVKPDPGVLAAKVELGTMVGWVNASTLMGQRLKRGAPHAR